MGYGKNSYKSRPYMRSLNQQKYFGQCYLLWCVSKTNNNIDRHSVKDIIIHQRTTASKDHWLQQNQSLPNSARPQILLSSLLLSRTEKKHNLVAEWAMRANKHQLDSCARVFFFIYVREGNSGSSRFWRYFIFRKLRKCTSKSNYKSICLEIFLALCIEKKILWNRK